MFQSEKPETAVWLLCAVILLITLFFGLKPKGFRFYNQVQWLQDKNAIAFQNIGMAYSRQTLGAIGISNSLGIIVVLKPYRTARHLSKIISIIDNQGRELLGLQQWIKGLEIVLWDAGGNRLGKVGIGDALSTDSSQWVAITVTRSEMKLFLKKSPGVSRIKRIKLPSNFFAGGRLLLGLSASGRNSWRGEITGLALFKSEVESQQLYEYAKAWDTINSHPEFADNAPAAVFLFNDVRGENIADRSGNGWDLIVPFYPKFFKHEVLSVLPDFNKISRNLVLDIIVNFFGFFPLGVCLYWAFLTFHFSSNKTIIITVGCAVAVSISIELLQALIPTRASQLIDVFFNGAGAWAGVILVRVGLNIIRRNYT